MNGIPLDFIINGIADRLADRMRPPAAPGLAAPGLAAPGPAKDMWGFTSIVKDTAKFIIDNPKKALVGYGIFRVLTSLAAHEAGSHALAGINHLSGAWENSASAVNALSRAFLPIATLVEKTSGNIGEMYLENVLPYVAVGTATLFGALYVIEKVAVATREINKYTKKTVETTSSQEADPFPLNANLPNPEIILKTALNVVNQISKSLAEDKTKATDEGIHKQLNETMQTLLQIALPFDKKQQQELMETFKTQSAENKLNMVVHILMQKK